LGLVRAGRIVMAAQELILADEPVRFEGRAIVVRLIGDGPGLPS
jgi:hypothetical protein